MIDLEAIKGLIREAMREVLREERSRTRSKVTIAEYANARSISRSTVRKALRDGRLVGEKYGRTIRIDADAEIGVPIRASNSNATAVNADRILKVVRGGAR